MTHINTAKVGIKQQSYIISIKTLTSIFLDQCHFSISLHKTSVLTELIKMEKRGGGYFVKSLFSY